MAAADYSKSDEEVVHDFFPLLREYKDGRIVRFLGTDFVPPEPLDEPTGVQSKDVQIPPEINLAARLYLPKNATPSSKLPILLYFHGGGFLIESAFSAQYHNHLKFLVAEANIVAVSLNYRLAPEHPLPIGFEDSWLALKWVGSHATGQGQEPWIKDYADLNRLYLGGDSAGGTIAHHVALRAGVEKWPGAAGSGVTLVGAFLNCPYFWGEVPLGDFEVTSPTYSKAFVDNLWHYACPTTKGCDDPEINPAMDPRLGRLGCKRLLIYVAGKDVLRGRGLQYKEALVEKGWDGEAEIVDVDGEEHVFSVSNPSSENGMAMLKKVASFMNTN